MEKLDNYTVYLKIDEALKKLGLENLGGGDVLVSGENAIETNYKKGKYQISVILQNRGASQKKELKSLMIGVGNERFCTL